VKHLPKDGLKWVAAAFALAATATAEYEIARAIGMNQWIAAAVPGALDAYVVRALRAHREVLAAVIAMVGVNAASHLVTAGILPVEWPLITAVSAIAPLVLWRVHALGTPGDWRARKIWGLSKAEHAGVLASTEPACTACLHEHSGPCAHFAGTSGACTCGHAASTETEHERAPDNPEPPGTREHPEHAASTPGGGMPYLCAHGCVVWGDVGAHERAHEHEGWEPEHTASTLDLDVPKWVNPPSTPPVPVHAPYADHVHAGHTDPEPVLLPEVGNPVMRARHLTVVRGDEHTASTRTADDWNLEHVSTGVLTPGDTEHMERARELFHTLGRVPQFRALKEGTPSMGTPRARRIRAALKIENEGTD
jgi:hypothetical protein